MYFYFFLGMKVFEGVEKNVFEKKGAAIKRGIVKLTRIDEPPSKKSRTTDEENCEPNMAKLPAVISTTGNIDFATSFENNDESNGDLLVMTNVADTGLEIENIDQSNIVSSSNGTDLGCDQADTEMTTDRSDEFKVLRLQMSIIHRFKVQMSQVQILMSK